MTYLTTPDQKYGCLQMIRPSTWLSPAYQMLRFCRRTTTVCIDGVDPRTWINSINANCSRTWFNPSKCVVIQLLRCRTPVPSQYLLHGQVPGSVAGSRYLGEEISSNLSFNSHIQKVSTSASQSMGFLKRYIRSKKPTLREMAYKSLVRPVVEYSSSVWSSYTKMQHW